MINDSITDDDDDNNDDVDINYTNRNTNMNIYTNTNTDTSMTKKRLVINEIPMLVWYVYDYFEIAIYVR